MAVSSVNVTVNGETYSLTFNETSGKYETTITAPTSSSYPLEGHYYPMQVTATDDAGNTSRIDANDETFGESLRLVVKEKVKPEVEITYPTEGAHISVAMPEIAFKVTDDDSGIDPDTIAIEIDGTKYTEGITKTEIEGGYECTYTPGEALSDAEHTITVTVSDYDGNEADAVSATFTVDTVPPTLVITSPDDGAVSAEPSITVSGITNDSQSSPVTVVVSVNGKETTAEVGADGSFTVTVDLADGENTIVITATDAAGDTTTVTRTVTYDNQGPVFISVTVTPNPVDAGNTYIISVEVEDD